MEENGDLFNQARTMTAEIITKPADIENKLSEIWESFQGTNKMRACLFNLVIYTKNNARIDYFYKISQKLIEKFPSRLLFISIDEEAKEPILKTSVSVVTAGSGENTIACDMINIRLSHHNQERAKFLLLPHLLPDLPLYLVWSDDPKEDNALTKTLESLATRVIFDSESTDNLCEFASSLIEHKTNHKTEIADLNWARIEGWRQLLRDTFKDQSKLDELNSIASLKINYNCRENEFFCHTKIQAIYLQGWLTNQLGFKCQKVDNKKDNSMFTFSKENQQIQSTLIPISSENIAPGRIESLEIELTDKKLYKFERSKEYSHIINVHVSTTKLCELPTQFIFDRYESGGSLIKEIFHQGTSQHFFNLLHTLKTIPKESLQ